MKSKTEKEKLLTVVLLRMINEKIPYKIGCIYKYTESENLFELKKVDRFIFHFKCGHRCTDSVFLDLINTENNIQVYKQLPPKQLKLNL